MNKITETTTKVEDIANFSGCIIKEKTEYFMIIYSPSKNAYLCADLSTGTTGNYFFEYDVIKFIKDNVWVLVDEITIKWSK